MLAEDTHLHDWNISVHGKTAALRETEKSFAEAESIEVRMLALCENSDTVAGELHIMADGRINLYVVDVVFGLDLSWLQDRNQWDSSRAMEFPSRVSSSRYHALRTYQ